MNNNVKLHIRKMARHLKFYLHKKNKRWVILSSVALLALSGGVAITSPHINVNAMLGVVRTAYAKTKLPYLSHVKENRLKLNESMDRSKTGGVKVMSGSGVHVHKVHLYTDGSIGGDIQGIFMGAPNHFNHEIPDWGSTHSMALGRGYRHMTNANGFWDYYNIGRYHGGLDYGDLQDSSGANSVWKANLGEGDNATPPSQVKAFYPQSIKVAIPDKTDNGYHFKRENVGIKITDIKFYKPWRGEHSIVFSRNLSDGLQYNGIKSMNVDYTILDNNGQPVQNLNNAYFEFNGVDAISKYGKARSNTQDDSTNNESRTRYLDDVYVGKHYKSARGEDRTGEFVIPADGSGTAYAGSRGTTEYHYFSKILNRAVDGGLYGTVGTGNNRNIIVAMNGNDVNIKAGSGNGYGSFHPTTTLKVPKRRPNKKRQHKHYTPPQSTTPITKTTNQQNITHPGEDYSYTIQGTIPKWKYYNTAHYTRDWNPGFPGFWWNNHYYAGQSGFYGPWYVDYHYNKYQDDHYRLNDNVPNDVSIQSIDTDGMPVNQNGNHVSMNLDPSNMESYSGRHYKITIHVKANRLPGLTGSGDTTDGSQVGNAGGIGSGWLNWYNQATADEKVYTKDNDYEQANEHSKKVRNRIRKVQYHVYQYDYNHDQNGLGDGSNVPSSEMPGHDQHSLSVPGGDNDDGGNNDQYHGNFDDDAILDKQTHIGYEGTHIKVPILKDRYNTYTDENGHEQHGRYRFAYNENTDNVYPVLGGFDNTTKGSKQSGHLTPGSPETSSFEKDGYNNNGQADPNDSSYGDDSDVHFKMDFYKPYIIPRAKTTQFGRFIVDTDKQNAGDKGLPFRLDFKTLNYVHNFDDDFAGDTIHVRITDPDSGSTLYDNDVSMDDSRFFSPYHHGDGHKGTRLVEFKDRLNTNVLPKMRKGAKVPLHVDVGFSDPSQAQLDGQATDSHGWISSENNMTGSGNNNETEDHTDEEFNHGSKSKFIEPERTIKYFTQDSDDDPRTQFEQFEIDQDHKQPATLKTGYGLRNDMKIKYTGLLGANASGNDWANGDTQTGDDYRNQVKQGSTTDFVFPQSWTKQDNDIKYSHKVPYGKDNISDPSGNTHAMYHDFDDSHKEAGYSKFAESGHDTYDKADTSDRMEHTNESYNFSDFDDTNLPENLDTLSDMDDPSSAKSIDNAYDTYNGGEYNEHLKAGTYSTDYQFYPRSSVRGNGDIQLKSDFDDPLASNDPTKDIGSSVISDLNGSDINRMFTPYWLPLGYYNVGFEKAQPSQQTINGQISGDGQTNGIERLGGNYFNFENDREDQATAHMYLADQSKSEGLDSQGHGSDELSIQPILSGHKHNGHVEYSQMPFGFTSADYNWLTGQDINETK